MICNPCSGTGFKNLHQMPDDVLKAAENSDDFCAAILAWMAANTDHDVGACDCCGDGDSHYGEPGYHEGRDFGSYGPYAYNGGRPECS